MALQLGNGSGIYTQLKQFETQVPTQLESQGRAANLSHLGMQTQALGQEQAAKMRSQKVAALGQEMEQIAKLPEDQRAEYHAMKQREFASQGIIQPNEMMPYDPNMFQRGLAAWRSTPEFAALDKERAAAEHLRAQAAKDRSEKSKMKPLAAEQSDKLAGHEAAQGIIGDIRNALDANKGDIGPIAGRLASLNPYNQRGQAMQALLKKATQVIGKALEGGKMTDADYAKYEKMLPKQSDTPEVAADKLDQVERLVATQKNSELDTYGKAGLDVAGFSKSQLKDIGITKKQQRSAAGENAQAASPPKHGTVEDGYVFMGGDPANPKSWKRAK